MNRFKTTCTALLPGLSLVLVVGCAGIRPASDAKTAENENTETIGRSGGIAAAAGEESNWDSMIDGREAKRQPFSFTEGLIRGQVAGVEVRQLSNGYLSLRIRGPRTLFGSTEPLYVVDGMTVLNSAGGIPINPHDIKKIEILKDADSKALYGSQAANGVVLITTKFGPYDYED